MQITFKVNGLEQLSRNLRVFAVNLPKMKEWFQESCEIVAERSDKIFGSAGTNVEKNPAWKPLAPSTLKARSRGWGYYGRTSPNKPGVLRWSGRLQESRTITANDLSGMLTFDATYAMYHQEGGGRLPRRAIIDLDNKTNTEIVKALQKKIERDMGVFGLQV